MFRVSTLAAAALALVVPTSPALATGDSCPPGSTRETETYIDTFGPELARWRNETLVVPKFDRGPDETLIGVELELCANVMGSVAYTNLGEAPCTLTYEVEFLAAAMAADPASPVLPFQVSAAAQGGPIQLGPGEGGMEAFDSGVQCAPTQTFFDPVDLEYFVATPGDDELVLDHAGVSNTVVNGCAALLFNSEAFSTLTLRVTYTYCAGQPNNPPKCRIVPVGEVVCQGDTTVVMLDGSYSEDPEDDPLTYLWSSDCPNSFFDDATSATPLLTIDTSGGCDLMCTVYLTVNDGGHDTSCMKPIRVVPPPGELYFCTQTQGGWGNGCHGHNPGCLRDMYFDLAFPNGLVVGDADGVDGDDRYALVLSSSQAVEDFLPNGGPPSALTQDTTDPGSTPAGVFAAQLVAATLNVGFDAEGVGLCTLTNSCDFPNPPGTMATLVYVDGCVADGLVGLSVAEVLALANEAISGGDLPAGVSYSNLSDALTVLNEEFDDCGTGSGCLALP
jgi:hypothetical protein